MKRQRAEGPERFAFVTDFHYGFERVGGAVKPLHDSRLMGAILTFLSDFQPEHVILGGDMLDCGAVSHHNRGKSGRTEGLKLLGDAVGLRKELLTPLEQVVPKAKLTYHIGNHECLDPESRVFSRRGWLGADDVRGDDELYTINRETGRGEWQRPTDVVKRPYSGDMLHFQSRDVNQLVTPGHQMLRKMRGSGSYALEDAETLGQHIWWNMVLAAPTDAPENSAYSDDELRILAWFLTDGGYSGASRSVFLYQRASRVGRITDLLDRLGFAYTLNTRRRVAGNFKANEDACEVYVRAPNNRWFYERVPNRHELPAWLDTLSARQLRLFLDTCVDGDGSRFQKSQSTVIYAKNGAWAERYMELAIRAGLRVSLTEYRPTHWRVNLNERPTSTITQRAERVQVKDSYVWCVSVPNRTILVRRGNQAAFVGNCWIQDLIDEQPGLEGIISVPKLLELGPRWQVVAQGGVSRLGKLYFAHGDQFKGGEHIAKAAVIAFERNIRFGHHHCAQLYSKNTAIDLTQVKTGAAVPCVCLRGPGYGKGAPNKWAQGFLWGYTFPDGTFTDYLTIAAGGKFAANGRVYRG